MVDEIFDYPAYLIAKKAVDDQSLNQQVWATMHHWIKNRQATVSKIKILEVGAGIGTMIERFLDEELVKDSVYTAIEQEVHFKENAFNYLNNLYKYTINVDGENWYIENRYCKTTVKWVTGDATNINEIIDEHDYDIVISHAVIDLMPVPVFLPLLFKHLKAGSAFYFSLNFSGKTEFLPVLENDEHIYREYHKDMDRRFNHLNWRASQTGEELGSWLINQGHKVEATGPSDWQLSEDIDNTQALFILNILQTMEKALNGLPELDDWLTVRYQQLKAGELSLKISNVDYFGKI